MQVEDDLMIANECRGNVRIMSNGKPEDLHVAVVNLRIYGVVLLAASLFFLGWSIITYFIVDPFMAIYGMLSFSSSAITAIALLTNKVLLSGFLLRCNLIATHIGNCAYFAATALHGHKANYGAGFTVMAGILFGVWILAAAIGYNVLSSVQMLMALNKYDDDSQCEEDHISHCGEDDHITYFDKDMDVLPTAWSRSSGFSNINSENARSLSFGDV